VYFEHICWKFAGRLLDRVNTLLVTHSLKLKHLSYFILTRTLFVRELQNFDSKRVVDTKDCHR